MQSAETTAKRLEHHCAILFGVVVVPLRNVAACCQPNISFSVAHQYTMKPSLVL